MRVDDEDHERTALIICPADTRQSACHGIIVIIVDHASSSSTASDSSSGRISSFSILPEACAGVFALDSDQQSHRSPS